ncbi:hypothetical protein DPSP01_013979 [Paraphaeosphaeria sporulosa]
MGSHTELPLTRVSVVAAHDLIKPHIYFTPVQTNTTLLNLASTPHTAQALNETLWEGQAPLDRKSSCSSNVRTSSASAPSRCAGHRAKEGRPGLDAVIAPCGCGGMLAGGAVALRHGIKILAAEPRFEGGDDARRGVAVGERITTVKTLTIADGLRTPLGETNWKIVADPSHVHSLYLVTEDNIRDAMRLVLEVLHSLPSTIYIPSLPFQIQFQSDLAIEDASII